MAELTKPVGKAPIPYNRNSEDEEKTKDETEKKLKKLESIAESKEKNNSPSLSSPTLSLPSINITDKEYVDYDNLTPEQEFLKQSRELKYRVASAPENSRGGVIRAVLNKTLKEHESGALSAEQATTKIYELAQRLDDVLAADDDVNEPLPTSKLAAVAITVGGPIKLTFLMKAVLALAFIIGLILLLNVFSDGFAPIRTEGRAEGLTGAMGYSMARELREMRGLKDVSMINANAGARYNDQVFFHPPLYPSKGE